MEYENLYPVLMRLIEKYRDFSFERWLVLCAAGEALHDYSDNSDELPAPIDGNAFWQAHTNVLEIGENENGRFSNSAEG
jgi:hypothetical protein